MSLRHVVGANSDSRCSFFALSSVTESHLSHAPFSSAPLPLATYTWPLRPSTGPGGAHIPASRAVGTA